MNSRSKYSPVW